jgi:hypothetical protein
VNLRRSRSGEPELLDDRLTRPPREPRPPRDPAEPARSPLAFLSDANNAMWAGGQPTPPSRMQPPEDQVGYVLALVIVVLGIVLTVTTGKGSPKHPMHWIQIIGLVAAGLTPVAIFRFANRFITAMLVVVAAFCISLVHPANSVGQLSYVVLIAPLGYAFWLTRRQSKAARAQNSRDRSGRGPNQRDTAPKRGGRHKERDVIVPVANRRYTPPKGPRERPKRSEIAAAPQEQPSRRQQRRKQAAQDKAAKRG